jgi:hypothetical protein
MIDEYRPNENQIASCNLFLAPHKELSAKRLGADKPDFAPRQVAKIA